MNCKNCKNEISQEASFCNNYGAKVIDNRLTFKLVTEEFFATFISWDNKFLKTLLHMFYKPDVVVRSYLNGVRKRYMQPFAFMLIALTLYGVFMFFTKDYLLQNMESMYNEIYNTKTMSSEQIEFQKNMNGKIMEYSLKYFNITTFVMIPFFALINLIIFRRKLNFVEFSISVLYTYASYQYGFLILSILLYLVGVPLNTILIFSYIYMTVYHMYFFKKYFKLSFWQILYKTILFLLLLVLIIGVFSILTGVLLAMFTDIFDAMKPK